MTIKCAQASIKNEEAALVESAKRILRDAEQLGLPARAPTEGERERQHSI